jgi:hypothetical protein
MMLFIPQLVNFYYGIINKMGEGSTWKWGLAPDLSFIPSILISFSSIKLPYEMATITMYQNIFNGNLDRWLAMIIILSIFSLGTFSSLMINKEATILSLSWIGIFILTAFLAAFKISIAEKYILPILPIYLIIVSIGLIHIKQKCSLLFAALIILILIFNSYSLYYYYGADSTVEDWRSASLYIQENLYHNDKIIITPSYTITGFTYYGLDQGMIVDLDAYGLKEDAPVKKISEMSSAKERLWIPYMPGFTTPSSDPDHALFRWLAQNCTKKYETEGIIIYLYDTHSKILYEDPIFIKSNLNSSEPFMILGTGWHGIENWSGVPTHWQKSDASLIINSLENRTYDLSLNARSFQRNRYLEIYLGDALRAVYLINPSDFTALTLPLYLSNGSNVVRFHIPDGCDCPCDMPELNSTDPRCLSLAVQNISCRRLE